MAVVVHETPAFIPARDAVLDLCFGPLRHLKTCERLREGRRPAAGLAFAAMEGDRLVGTLRLWPILAGSAGPALLLGPLGVQPERRGEGIGAGLVRHAVHAARQRGHAAILLVGDLPYYAPFGFLRGRTRGLSLPGPVDPDRFLGLDLVHGALDGACGAVVALDTPIIGGAAPTNAPNAIRTISAPLPIAA